KGEAAARFVDLQEPLLKRAEDLATVLGVEGNDKRDPLELQILGEAGHGRPDARPVAALAGTAGWAGVEGGPAAVGQEDLDPGVGVLVADDVERADGVVFIAAVAADEAGRDVERLTQGGHGGGEELAVAAADGGEELLEAVAALVGGDGLEGVF